MLIALGARDDVRAFEQMLEADSLRDIAKLPGYSAAAAFRFGTDQMMTLPARHSHVIFCHLSDPALAAASWSLFMANPTE